MTALDDKVDINEARDLANQISKACEDGGYRAYTVVLALAYCIAQGIRNTEGGRQDEALQLHFKTVVAILQGGI